MSRLDQEGWNGEEESLLSRGCERHRAKQFPSSCLSNFDAQQFDLPAQLDLPQGFNLPPESDVSLGFDISQVSDISQGRRTFSGFDGSYESKTPHGFGFSRNVVKPQLDSTRLFALAFFKPASSKSPKLKLPFFETSVSAGYPSPVDDPFTRHLDLSRYLVKHPQSTYYFKVVGYSMVNAGINHRDLLVVDTALKPKHRDIIIALLDGEFKLKRFYVEGSQIKLLSANPDYPAIAVSNEMDFFVQGVVTTVIRTFNPLPYDNHFKNISYPYF